MLIKGDDDMIGLRICTHLVGKLSKQNEIHIFNADMSACLMFLSGFYLL